MTTLHRSPAFTAIYNDVKRSQKNRILDFGPMGAEGFRLFSQLACKMHVEDLRQRVVDNEPDAVDAAIASLTSLPNNTKFDIVLLWDLLNYLSIQDVQRLMDYVRPFCHRGTLFYIIRYPNRLIPRSPVLFRIVDQYQHACEVSQRVPREFPPYNTSQLLRAFSDCYVHDTIRAEPGMMDGVVEQVLHYSPSDIQKRQISRAEMPRVQRKAGRAGIHVSPAMLDLLSLISSSEDSIVLDLGASQNRCEDAIVQHAGQYFRLDVLGMRDRGFADLRRQLPLDRPCDLILAWDVLNYLTAERVTELTQSLANFLGPHTFFHSLMYTRGQRPDTPGFFDVDGEGRMHIALPTDNAPLAITGASLIHAMASLRLEQSFAFRPGMSPRFMEYVFSTAPEHNQNDLSPSLPQQFA